MPSRTLRGILVLITVLLVAGCASHRGGDAVADRLADRLAVGALANQYAWGVDTLDRGLLGRTFAPDAKAHYVAVGPNPMNLDERLAGFDAIYGWLDANLSHRKATAGLPMHFVSNELVELRDDEASLRFYMHNRASSVGGVYYVEAARRAEGWRIVSLRLEEQTWNAAAYAGDEHAQQYFAPADESASEDESSATPD